VFAFCETISQHHDETWLDRWTEMAGTGQSNLHHCRLIRLFGECTCVCVCVCVCVLYTAESTDRAVLRGTEIE